MGRAPFPGTPTPAPQAPVGMPQPRPVAPQQPPVRQPSEKRMLVVGRGISVQGVVQDAERLVVEGTVESTMIHAAELIVAQGGVFRGEVEVEDSEVAGTIDGTLTARGNLIVRATGKVLGTARCRRLQVEDGGQITGRIEMITEPARAEPARPAEPAA
ncbi:MAG: polymer-forming cytoskeletal protein [Rhodospirillales bacterium]|nr:polymer-forming cytoskeletal protein [Rhodospirillales bacterium]